MSIVAAVTALIIVSAGWVLKLDENHLQVQLSENMPVRAVDFIKRRGLQGPLFNDFNWGGYLMWSLRIPVSIDGRATLQGDKHIDDSVATWTAQPRWASNEELAKAGLVIGPVNYPLIQILRLDPRYQLAFEDKVAVVFISKNVALKQRSELSERMATVQSASVTK